MELDLDALKKGRYLLYIDILGFANLVEKKSPEEIYSIIDASLRSFSHWENCNKSFKTICFSDTFLFYQESNSFADWAFLDIYAISAMLFSALLSQEIPTRGTITFGEFEVRNDSTNRHQLFFGKALVEAYRKEQMEKWIGITIQPSAWYPYEKFNRGVISTFEKEGVWRKRGDDVLLLNPFIKIRSSYVDDLIDEINIPYMEWNQPEFPNEIVSLKFLLDRTEELKRNGRFTDPIAIKYHATLAFIKDILGEDAYAWAKKITECL